MKALFNGTCSLCRGFLPRCSQVFVWLDGKPHVFLSGVAVPRQGPSVLCPSCRRECRGQYRLDARHK